jgi:hypothetical protein
MSNQLFKSYTPYQDNFQIIKSPENKPTRLQSRSSLVLPTLLCGSESWMVNAEDKSRMIITEMQFKKKQRNTFGWPIKEMKAC